MKTRLASLLARLLALGLAAGGCRSVRPQLPPTLDPDAAAYRKDED